MTQNKSNNIESLLDKVRNTKSISFALTQIPQ
jgi:hypothetical protein